jgi:GxxExxY protein
MSMNYWKTKYDHVIKNIKISNIKIVTQCEINNFEFHLLRICKSIYDTLGPTLLEKNYQDILYEELKKFYENTYIVKYEENISVYFENRFVTTKRIDISIYKKDNSECPIFLLELKSTDTNTGHYQLYQYMNITGCTYGYLINFSKNLTFSNFNDVIIKDICTEKNIGIKTNASVCILKFEKTKKFQRTDSVINSDIKSEINSIQNKNKKWTVEHDNLLCSQIEEGLPLENICSIQGRTEYSILCRVVKLKLFDNNIEAKKHFKL